MGKNLIQQRRGKGSSTFKSPEHRYIGKVTIGRKEKVRGVIIDLVRDALHSAPLALVKFENGEEVYIPAFEGAYVGQIIEKDSDIVKPGNIVELSKIPEGTRVYMVEKVPGDGGKLIRVAGASGIVVARDGNNVKVKMPSGAIKVFNAKSRAVVGVIAAAGIKEKPILKAGKKWHIMHAKHKYWPNVSASSMNAVDHPFGGGRKHRHTGRPETTSRHAPPGRKVGYIAARRTGRKR